MPFRFRKSFRIAPGVKVNLSKTGTSLSLGGKGASVNIGRKRVRTTVGLPGTGVSYSEDVSYARDKAARSAERPEARQPAGGFWKLALVILAGLAFAGFHLLSS
ncbi:MAG TPA: DUF4236 domain-containing protein [Bellilinea sp.]|nr:DUF4236 domain-containing protein [Bellilinea sp.]